MNMVKQGIGLRSIKSFESVLASDMVQEFWTCEDRVFLRIYGYEQLIGLSIQQKVAERKSGDLSPSSTINVTGFDVSRNF